MDASVEKVKTRRLRKKKPTAPLQQEQEEQVVPQVEPKKKKAPKPKKKKEQASSSSTTTAPTELKQGEHVIDYQRLHDALRESFSIDDKRGDIHFAPLTKSAATRKYEKSISSTTSNRNSNQNAPSAKSKKEPFKLLKKRLTCIEYRSPCRNSSSCFHDNRTSR